jgi:hypothetical protein
VESSAVNAGGLYLWSNLVGWSGGSSGLWVADGSGASVGWNTVYASSSGVDLSVGSTEDIGNNASENPQFTDFNDNGTPSDDDLSLAASSPARDSGPADGSGPTGFTEWSDLDGSANDRGHTGGPEAE